MNGMEYMNYPFATQVRVSYRDVDMQKVVHNSNYLHYAELGRIEYLRSRGLPYQQVVHRHNLEMVVVESHCFYKSPARFDDLLTIRVGLGDIGRSSFKVYYQIDREATGDLIAEVKTHHVCVDRESFKPVRIPDPILELFEPDTIEMS